MSAIFGIIDFEGRSLDPAWIKSMQSDLAHRGPDGQGLYEEQGVALGHMLLQVTPESVYDKSPYEEDGLVITANARLDEREAIMDRIGTPQSERDKITDPLLLLRSFKKFGKDFVKNIYGDFAFAIWDKNKRELFCARDQVGVKPFLYYFGNCRLVFSTELKSIVNLPFVEKEIDNIYFRNQLLYIEDQPETTNWKNIKRLKSANYLLANSNNMEFYLYWEPIYNKSNPYLNIESSAMAILNVLNKAVADRMRVKGQVGVPLSGGLDSSTITCIAARKVAEKGGSIVTVSSILDPTSQSPNDSDEMVYIQSILDQEKNINPSFIYHSDLSFVNNLDNKFNRYFTLFNIFNYADEALYEKFSYKGVRRVMHGYLGDLTVSTKDVHPFIDLFQRLKFKALIKLILSYKKCMKMSLFKIFLYQFIKPLYPVAYTFIINKLKGQSPPWIITNIPLKINDNERKIIQRKRKKYFRRNTQYNFNKAEYFWPYSNDFLREDWDTGSSYYQIEITYPFVDRRVIECLMRIPVEHFFSNGYDRGLVRKVMHGIIPKLIVERQNKGYYSPGFNQIIKRDLEKFMNLIDIKLIQNQKTGEIFDIKKIRSHIERFLNSNFNINFTDRELLIVDISMWLYFNLWFQNEYLNKQEYGKENKIKVAETFYTDSIINK